MKQKDILLLVVVGIVSAVISVLMSNLLIAPKKNRLQKAEIVDVIRPDFTLPDARYFNKDSINLTKLITIGDNSNDKPFNDGKKR